MTRYKLRNGKVIRRKALFGSEEAAILGAAAIGAGATAAAAAVNAKATTDAAKRQADTQLKISRDEVAAMNRSNELANQNMEQQLATIKDQFERNRDIAKDTQLNIQMLAGQQNEEDRRSRNNIIAAKGVAYTPTFLLRGNSQPEFTVTDGGVAVPVGKTKNGFDLVKFSGDKHYNRHRLANGKKAGGIGISFGYKSPYEVNKEAITGNTDLEVEDGEYGIVTPNKLYVLSARNNKGFNPAKNVDKGMDAEDAYNIQEAKKGNKRKLRNYGGYSNVVPPIPVNIADDVLMSNPVVVRNSYKNGGAKRLHCAPWGDEYSWSQLGGAGISALGNLAGMFISNSAVNRGANIAANAAREAASIRRQGYANLRGIDSNIANTIDTSTAHYMPALQAVRTPSRAPLAQIDRVTTSRLGAIRRNTLSGVAAIDRVNAALDRDIANKEQVYATAQQAEDAIAARNAEAINQAAAYNAAMAQESNKARTNLGLRVAEYNANTRNQSVLGQADATAQGLENVGDIYSNAVATIGQSTSNTINTIGNTIGNTVATIGSRYSDMDMIIAGADSDVRAAYIANNYSDKQAKAAYDNYMRQGNTKAAETIANIRGWQQFNRLKPISSAYSNQPNINRPSLGRINRISFK